MGQGAVQHAWTQNVTRVAYDSIHKRCTWQMNLRKKARHILLKASGWKNLTQATSALERTFEGVMLRPYGGEPMQGGQAARGCGGGRRHVCRILHASISRVLLSIVNLLPALFALLRPPLRRLLRLEPRRANDQGLPMTPFVCSVRAVALQPLRPFNVA